MRVNGGTIFELHLSVLTGNDTRMATNARKDTTGWPESSEGTGTLLPASSPPVTDVPDRESAIATTKERPADLVDDSAPCYNALPPSCPGHVSQLLYDKAEALAPHTEPEAVVKEPSDMQLPLIDIEIGDWSAAGEGLLLRTVSSCFRWVLTWALAV